VTLYVSITGLAWSKAQTVDMEFATPSDFTGLDFLVESE